MAKIKMQYDNESDIPTEYADLYEEKEGKWQLSVEGGPANGSVARLEATLKKEREARKKAEDLAKKFQPLADRDVDEVLEVLDEVDELRAKVEAGGGDKPSDEAIQKRIDAEVKRATGKIQRELDKVKGEAEGYKKQADEHAATIRSSKLNTEVTRAATSLKMRPEAIEDAVLIAERIFEVGDDGKPLTKDGLDPSAWLQDQKQKRPHWWLESAGGGATGGNGDRQNGANPFDKKSPNFSKAAQLMKADPQKADQYARSAGFKDANAGIDAMATQKAKQPRF